MKSSPMLVYCAADLTGTTDVGIAMGKQIGELTVEKFLKTPH